jgi:hypothetical protein
MYLQLSRPLLSALKHDAVHNRRFMPPLYQRRCTASHRLRDQANPVKYSGSRSCCTGRCATLMLSRCGAGRMFCEDTPVLRFQKRVG